MDAHTYRDDSALLKTNFARTVGLGMSMRLSCLDGRSFTYRISEIQLHLSPGDYRAVVASRRLYAVDGPPQVVMVTCTDWDAIRGVWNNRAILIATPTF